MKRLIFVMIDGFGDVNDHSRIEDFFSSIKVPNLNKYFLSPKDSYYGILDPVEPGIACGSDTAHLSIFGFDPVKYYCGRGAFETIGAGISISPGEIAFKCNFASMEINSGTIISRRPDKDFAIESSELCKYLQENLNRKGFLLEKQGITVTIKHATEHRCSIKIKKKDIVLSDKITGTDPLYDNLHLMKCKAHIPDDRSAAATSEIINQISSIIVELLSKHFINENRIKAGKIPANVILFRGCSSAPNFPNFESFHNINWNSIFFARTCIISGIGECLGFKRISLIDDSISIEKDMMNFLDSLAVDNCSRFGFFHIKDVDEASHEQDYSHKSTLINSIDEIIGKIIERLKSEFSLDEFRIVVTGDHSTLCRIGEHSCEPVPFLISCPISFKMLDASSDSESNIFNCYSSVNLGRFLGDNIIEFLAKIIN